MASRRQLIDSPVTFTQSQFGLQSVVVPVTPADPHWQNGVDWQPECGTVTVTYDDCLVVTGSGEGVGTAPPPANKTGTIELGLRGAQPFTVMAEFDCTVVGMSRATEIARQSLTRMESAAVEEAFWTGLVQDRAIVFPHLAADTEVIDDEVLLQSVATTSPAASGGVDVATGLGLLEQALGDCYGGQGVIHVPLTVLPTMFAEGLVRVSGGQIRTQLGNLVAAGVGYPGTSPSGAEPPFGQAWVYATSPVFQYRGRDRVRGSENESIDRASNTRKMIVERTYLLGWDCCHEAVLVDYGVKTGA